MTVFDNQEMRDMVRTASAPDWREGFLFVGNHPALDFLNTRPVLDGGEATELLPDFAALLRWLRVAGMIGSRDAAQLPNKWKEPDRPQRIVDSARRLREKLRKEILKYEERGKIHASLVDEINTLMAACPMRTRLKAGKDRFAAEAYFDLREPEDLLSPIAHVMASLFADLDRKKIRKCSNCVLHFYDGSKKGTRRWCSMRLCGNRVKVAAYAARHR